MIPAPFTSKIVRRSPSAMLSSRSLFPPVRSQLLTRSLCVPSRIRARSAMVLPAPWARAGAGQTMTAPSRPPMSPTFLVVLIRSLPI
jgi:hypothetical protein